MVFPRQGSGNIGGFDLRSILLRARECIRKENADDAVCQSCHNDVTMKGNLSLKGFDVDSASNDLETSEKMIRKLRADIMPPPGSLVFGL